MDSSSLKVPERKEISDACKWDLSDIYESDKQWEEEFAIVKERISEIKQYKGKISKSATALLELLELSDKLSRKLSKLYSYATRKSDQDTTITKYQSLKGRAQSLNNKFNSTQSFIVPEIIKIPEAKLNNFIAKEEGLKLYRQYLDDIIRRKKHFLSAREEKIIALTGDLAQGPENVFSMLNNADVQFPTIEDDSGKKIEVSHGRYIDLLRTASKRVRGDAFKAYHNIYQKQKNTLAANLDSNIKKDVFYMKTRNYESSLEASLDKNNIPTTVYDNLLTTINDNVDLMYDYLKLKQKALGTDKLHIYDVYKPLVEGVDLEIDYKEAQTIILEALAPLGDEYISNLAKALNDNWIDVYESKGKRSGAYSASCYDAHPYILMNYKEGISSLFTLAHELGHALHSHYSNKKQPYVYSGYSIFVAEVASTVNETLLMDYLLQNLVDDKQRLYLLDHYLEKFRGTVYRQAMFAQFEKLIHQRVERGETLTADLLSQLYLDLNRKYYGKDIILTDELAIEWARIPHFYYNFYVYQYATGFSAAVDLAEKISTDDYKVNNYLQFLESGSSDYPINVLKQAGIDMTSAQPVNNALEKFERLLRELEILI